LQNGCRRSEIQYSGHAFLSSSLKKFLCC
jgi:hypothetical protein